MATTPQLTWRSMWLLVAIAFARVAEHRVARRTQASSSESDNNSRLKYNNGSLGESRIAFQSAAELRENRAGPVLAERKGKANTSSLPDICDKRWRDDMGKWNTKGKFVVKVMKHLTNPAWFKPQFPTPWEPNEIISSFHGCSLTFTGGPGTSGAKMYTSADSAYMVKMVNGVELYQMYRVVERLEGGSSTFQASLLTPIFLVFQKCTGYSCGETPDCSKKPSALRSCSGMILSPRVDNPHLWFKSFRRSGITNTSVADVEYHSRMVYDLKLGGDESYHFSSRKKLDALGLTRSDDTNFTNTFKVGLIASSTDLQILYKRADLGLRNLVADIGIFDYSMLLVLLKINSEKGLRVCSQSTGSEMFLSFPVLDAYPKVSTDKQQIYCAVIGVIDYLGHDYQSYADIALGRSTSSHQPFAVKYLGSFLDSVLEVYPGCQRESPKKKDYVYFRPFPVCFNKKTASKKSKVESVRQYSMRVFHEHIARTPGFQSWS